LFFAEMKDDPRIGTRREVVEVFTDHEERGHLGHFTELSVRPSLRHHFFASPFDITQERGDDRATTA
jgi:hypothetical protein